MGRANAVDRFASLGMLVLQLTDTQGYSLVINIVTMTSGSNGVQPQFVRFALVVFSRRDNANTLTL